VRNLWETLLEILKPLYYLFYGALKRIGILSSAPLILKFLKIIVDTIPHNVQGTWVRGHNGHPENERCDELARNEAERIKATL